ncbi:MAG: lysylphosphatidylglycerol synthase domain-containing protein [Pirellulales bacterium]
MKWVKIGFRVLIVASVAVGIAHTVRKSLAEFDKHQFSLADLQFGWLLLAGLLYLLGSIPGWWFWHRVLVAMGQVPDTWASARAFYIGHLGKYVPGKAMVVVLRAGLVKGPRVETAVAAAAVFVETLTTMAVGAVIAAVIVAWRYHDQPQLVGLAVLLVLGAGVPAWPPVFRRVVKLLRIHRASPSIEPALAALDLRLMSRGWVAIALSWLLLGLSLWATLIAMPDPAPILFDMGVAIPLLTACVALAMVAGFVSMIPGGVGVREFVVITLLAPAVGNMAAVVSAILLRFVWLLAELASSAILYVMRPGAEPLAAEKLP